ncbi:MAG TPA: hypothetical protein IGS53_11105 [Leptolyngbyaceae cyanobacterium M33_DOE_097]|nr:hypothetical protein [Leptolyngbyaceae cyanobacterium M33_DOE_097]
MASLADVISYIHNNYPDAQNSLSVERLIKLIYLADWKYSISHDLHSQITSIEWRIRDFQPWMDNLSVTEMIKVLATIRVGKLLRISQELTEEQKRSLQFVIETAVEKNEDDLSRLVHSTFPAIKQNNSSSILDFSVLAREYEAEFKPFIGKRN